MRLGSRGGAWVDHDASSLSASRPSAQAGPSRGSIPCTGKPRAQLSCPASFIAVGRRLHRGGADCRLRLSKLGIGAISDHFLGPFDYMKGRTCQRGSFSGQTHDMVYRMGSANRLHRPTIPDGAHASISTKVTARLVQESWFISVLMQAPG